MKIFQFDFEKTNINIERRGKYDLPRNVKPEIYDLNLVTDLYAPIFSFWGEVTITVSKNEKKLLVTQYTYLYLLIN